MSKRNYKATMVHDPRGNEGGSDEFISQMSDVIRSVEGEVKKVENLGAQDFARKSSSNLANGVYFQFDIEAEPELPSRLLEKLSLEKNVDRIVVERLWFLFSLDPQPNPYHGLPKQSASYRQSYSWSWGENAAERSIRL